MNKPYPEIKFYQKQSTPKISIYFFQKFSFSINTAILPMSCRPLVYNPQLNKNTAWISIFLLRCYKRGFKIEGHRQLDMSDMSLVCGHLTKFKSIFENLKGIFFSKWWNFSLFAFHVFVHVPPIVNIDNYKLHIVGAKRLIIVFLLLL